MSEEVPLVSRYGEYIQSQPEDVERYISEGYQLDTPQYRQEQADKKTYGGLAGGVGAAALGLGNTVSFGLLSPLLSSTGVVEQETQAKLKDYNPTAYTAGEIGGFAVPGLGELGVLGKGAQTASKFAAPSLIGKAGRVIQQASEGAAEHILGNAAAKATSHALSSSAEMAAFQIANNISESAIHNKDFTVESALTNVGEAMAFGGGLGLALGAGLTVLDRLAKKTTAFSAKLGDQIAEEQRAIEAARPIEPLEPVGIQYPEKPVSGEFPEKPETPDILKPQPKRTDYTVESDISPLKDQKLLNKNIEEMKNNINGVHTTLGDATKRFEKFDGARDIENKKLLGDVFHAGSSEDLKDLAKFLNTEADNMLKDRESWRISATPGQESVVRPLSESPFKDVSKITALKRISSNLLEITEAENPISAYESFTAAKNAKKALADLGIWDYKPGFENNETIFRLKDAWKDLATHISDESLYGEAATFEKEINSYYKTYFESLSDAQSAVFRKLKNKNVLDASTTKISELLKGINNSAKLDKWNAVKAWSKASDDLVNKIAEVSQNNGVNFSHDGFKKFSNDFRAGYEEFGNAVEKHEVNLGEQKLAEVEAKNAKNIDYNKAKEVHEASLDAYNKKVADIKAEFETQKEVHLENKQKIDELNREIKDKYKVAKDEYDLANKEYMEKYFPKEDKAIYGFRTAGGAAGAMLGMKMGGPKGMLLGGAIGRKLEKALKIVAIPGSALRSVITLEGYNAQNVKKIADGVSEYMGKALNKTGSRYIPEGVGTSLMDHLNDKGVLKDGATSHDNEMHAYISRTSQIKRILNNPQESAEVMKAGFAKIAGQAPEITDKMVMKQMEIASFLAEKMPVNPLAGSTINPEQSGWAPNSQQVSTWMKYYKAAQDPTSVLKDLSNGTISKEGAETLARLYPETNKIIQEHLIRESTANSGSMSYQSKLALGQMFGVPLVPSATKSHLTVLKPIVGPARGGGHISLRSGSLNIAKQSNPNVSYRNK